MAHIKKSQLKKRSLLLVSSEGSGRFAGHQVMCIHFVVSFFSTLPLGTRGGLQSLILALPGDVSLLAHLS